MILSPPEILLYHNTAELGSTPPGVPTAGELQATHPGGSQGLGHLRNASGNRDEMRGNYSHNNHNCVSSVCQMPTCADITETWARDLSASWITS
jgi:hypothetical protein